MSAFTTLESSPATKQYTHDAILGAAGIPAIDTTGPCVVEDHTLFQRTEFLNLHDKCIAHATDLHNKSTLADRWDILTKLHRAKDTMVNTLNAIKGEAIDELIAGRIKADAAADAYSIGRTAAEALDDEAQREIKRARRTMRDVDATVVGYTTPQPQPLPHTETKLARDVRTAVDFTIRHKLREINDDLPLKSSLTYPHTRTLLAKKLTAPEAAYFWDNTARLAPHILSKTTAIGAPPSFKRDIH